MIDFHDWNAIYPEIFLLSMACFIALVDLFVRDSSRKLTYLLTLLTLVILVIFQAWRSYELIALPASSDWFDSNNYIESLTWNGLLVQDAMGELLKCFASVAVLFTLIYGRDYATESVIVRGGEFFVLLMFALLGIFILISSHHFLVLYLGLELLTLSSYALVALRRKDSIATEAAMKYFILGAMASGFLLYGISMLYGATGTLDIGELGVALSSGNEQVDTKVLVFGLVFIVAGLAFKFGAVPFHMWIPDVYHGAPTVVTLFIGSAPKLAAFAMAMRLLTEGLLPLLVYWQQMLVFLSVSSLLVGNLAAIMQNNIKRMLAYSTISHMGFVLLGLLAGVFGVEQQETIGLHATNSLNAWSATMFYSVTYVLTTLAAFGIVLLLGRDRDSLSDLAGLNQRSPLYAGIMAVCMLSMAGIPFFPGFWAKLSVLQAVVANSEAGQGLFLAIFAVIMSLIGAFYYLRVIKIMYFQAPNTPSAFISVQPYVSKLLIFNGFLIIILGLLPNGLFMLCQNVMVRSMRFIM